MTVEIREQTTQDILEVINKITEPHGARFEYHMVKDTIAGVVVLVHDDFDEDKDGNAVISATLEAVFLTVELGLVALQAFNKDIPNDVMKDLINRYVRLAKDAVSDRHDSAMDNLKTKIDLIH